MSPKLEFLKEEAEALLQRIRDYDDFGTCEYDTHSVLLNIALKAGEHCDELNKIIDQKYNT